MGVATVRVAEQFQNVAAGVAVELDFPLFAENEIEVVYGKACLSAILNADYTVALTADYSTFSVTPLQPLIDKINALIALDATEVNYITVRRAMSPLSSVDDDSVRRGSFLRREIERLHMHVVELSEKLFRVPLLNNKNVGTDPQQIFMDDFVGGVLLQVSDDGLKIEMGPTAQSIFDAEAAAQQAAVDAEAARDVAIARAAAADADKTACDADVALTHADVILTHADVVLTHADVVTANATAATVAADKAIVIADMATVAADKATTLGYKNAADADVVLTHADVVLTHADVVLTHADVVSTHADKAACDTDVTNATTQANTAAASATTASQYAAALNGTSTTSVLIATGTKNFTTGVNKQWGAGQFIEVVDQASNANWMKGQVISYDGSTGALSIDVQTIGGAGTKAAWYVYVSGDRGATGATGAPGPTVDIGSLTATAVDGAADYFVFLDATDSLNKKRLWNDIFTDTIVNFTAKATPTISDGTNIFDAAASNVPKKITLDKLFLLIDGLTDLSTSGDTADELAIYDVSATAAKKISFNNLMKVINTFTALTAVDTADSANIYDTSASAAVKATINEIFRAVNSFTALTAVDTADYISVYDTSATAAVKATVAEVFKAINSFTADTTPDGTADYVATYDASATSAKKVLINNLFYAINSMTADASPDSAADYVVTYDASASAPKKVLLSNLPGASGGTKFLGAIKGFLPQPNATSSKTDFTAGACWDSTGTVWIKGAAQTGKVNATAWSAGTNGGLLDTGTAGTHTYHVFVIASADGVTNVDFLISLSPTAPTLPGGYTVFRRILSITSGASANFWSSRNYNVLDIGGGAVYVVINNPSADSTGSTMTTAETTFVPALLPQTTGIEFGAELDAFFMHNTVSTGFTIYPSGYGSSGLGFNAGVNGSGNARGEAIIQVASRWIATPVTLHLLDTGLVAMRTTAASGGNWDVRMVGYIDYRRMP